MTYLTKTYQRHFQSALALSTLALAIPWQAGQAATLNVDTTADDALATDCTAIANDCSLRGAISIAINGDSITVPVGTYTLAGTEIPISVSLTINGAGSATTIIDGNNASRIFNVSAGTLTINGVTIQHGHAVGGQGGGIYSGSAAPLTLNDVKVLNNLSDLEGGGINAYNAPVTVTNSVFDGNISNGGGGCGGLQTFSANVTGTTFNNNRANGGNFGGLYGGVITLDQTTFTNNYAANMGGGLGATTSATVNNSTFQSNQAVNYGGGIYGNSLTLSQSQLLNNTVTNAGGQGAGVFLGANMTVTNSTIDSNISAGGCGGVRVATVLTATNTIISNNQSSSIGGGGCVNGAVLTNTQFLNNQGAISIGGSGGGLRIDNGTSTLQNVLFQNNTLLNGHGAGLYVFNGNVTLTNTRFLNNQASSSGGGLSVEAGTSTLQNVLFANNTASTGNGAAIFAFGSNTANIYHATVTSQTPNPKEAIYVNNATVNITVKNTIITNHATGVSNNGGTVTEDYNLFFGNTANLSGVTAGANSLTGDPLFVNAAANDYHLNGGSPAINSGVGGVGVTTDFEGETRPFGSAPDMGYDEAIVYNLTLATTGDATGTVSSSGTPAGASCGTNCLTYLSTSAVTLTATATTGTFTGWSCTPAFTSGSVLTADTTCTATFTLNPIYYNLTLATTGTGTGTISSSGSPTGTSCGANCLTYFSTTAVTLTAIATNNSAFANWSCTPAFTSGNVLTANTTCTATFNAVTPIAHYHLSVLMDGTGTGNVTGAGSYPEGTTVTLEAVPSPGSSFIGWSAGCSSAMTLTADTTCTATFEVVPPRILHIAFAGNGQGQLTGGLASDPTGIHCSTTTPACSYTVFGPHWVYPKFTPATGSELAGWSGDPACTQDGSSKILLLQDTHCTVTVNLKFYTLSVGRNVPGVTLTGDGLNCQDTPQGFLNLEGLGNLTTCQASYPYGTTVKLAASPAPLEWEWVGWKGSCDNQGQVVITQDRLCQAQYREDPNVPNGIDGNGDGEMDAHQPHVMSLADKVGGSYITLVVNPECVVADSSTLLADSLEGHDPNHRAPQGLMYFEIRCSQTPVTMYFHGINRVPRNVELLKYGPTTPGDENTVGWYKLPNVQFGLATVGGKPVATVTYTLTDGQLGDSTGVDGKIVDPAGMAW